MNDLPLGVCLNHALREGRKHKTCIFRLGSALIVLMGVSVLYLTACISADKTSSSLNKRSNAETYVDLGSHGSEILNPDGSFNAKDFVNGFTLGMTIQECIEKMGDSPAVVQYNEKLDVMFLAWYYCNEFLKGNQYYSKRNSVIAKFEKEKLVGFSAGEDAVKGDLSITPEDNWGVLKQLTPLYRKLSDKREKRKLVFNDANQTYCEIPENCIVLYWEGDNCHYFPTTIEPGYKRVWSPDQLYYCDIPQDSIYEGFWDGNFHYRSGIVGNNNGGKTFTTILTEAALAGLLQVQQASLNNPSSNVYIPSNVQKEIAPPRQSSNTNNSLRNNIKSSTSSSYTFYCHRRSDNGEEHGEYDLRYSRGCPKCAAPKFF